jgi:hypothetical protein
MVSYHIGVGAQRAPGENRSMASQRQRPLVGRQGMHEICAGNQEHGDRPNLERLFLSCPWASSLAVMKKGLHCLAAMVSLNPSQ